MKSYESLYVDGDTKMRIVNAKPRHAKIVSFINEVLDVYEVLTPTERLQIADRLAQREQARAQAAK